ncbi:MAG: ParA family protein [Planctomycetes bacterium]|nr:ParA family protein [Planctomycetota bacterium]
MRVIAVANQKGGVAKTTTCQSLAAAFAQDGRRVLAVDLDPQANLAIGFGLDPDPGQPSTYEVLAGRGVGLAQAALAAATRGLERLAVVPAGPRLAQAEAELLGQVGFDEVLERRLATAAPGFDVALIDCPPSLGALTINALVAADVVVVPVQCEFFSARGVVKLLDLVDLVRERRNPGLTVRLVPTLYDQRNGICKQVLGELRREFGDDVSPVAVGVDTRVREAQARGLPVTIYAPTARASEAYRALARDLAALLEREEAAHVQQAA